jgi:hypothetical protein
MGTSGNSFILLATFFRISNLMSVYVDVFYVVSFAEQSYAGWVPHIRICS